MQYNIVISHNVKIVVKNKQLHVQFYCIKILTAGRVRRMLMPPVDAID
jgi:hypothetical protein